MSLLVELALVALLAVGSFFVLVGSFGLVKLSEFFKRLHGPTKATTLGVGCILIASIGYHALRGDGLGLREILITLFLFITAPISAHLMARAALRLAPEQRPKQPEADAASLSEAAEDGSAVADGATRDGQPRDR
ncbi:Na+/H+ antiporter subunit G [Lysobacter sp. D1-1-M9]|uniref:Na+/H+ antiporter subunit G n=1 Tax=Novilysobacter longmucuonensis TaxID=3098603 RepID=UPI002FCA224B